jgi:hypothetical protein
VQLRDSNGNLPAISDHLGELQRTRAIAAAAAAAPIVEQLVKRALVQLHHQAQGAVVVDEAVHVAGAGAAV